MTVEEVIEITRIPVSLIAGIFFGYIISHLGFLKWYQVLRKKKERTEDEEKQYKILIVLAKWWHAIYLIIVVIYFTLR